MSEMADEHTMENLILSRMEDEDEMYGYPKLPFGEPVKKRRLKLQFKWFDLWVGIFIDTKKKIIYVCFVPTIIISFKYGELKESK